MKNDKKDEIEDDNSLAKLVLCKNAIKATIT
jgi:hypothetical protein